MIWYIAPLELYYVRLYTPGWDRFMPDRSLYNKTYVVSYYPATVGYALNFGITYSGMRFGFGLKGTGTYQRVQLESQPDVYHILQDYEIVYTCISPYLLFGFEYPLSKSVSFYSHIDPSFNIGMIDIRTFHYKASGFFIGEIVDYSYNGRMFGRGYGIGIFSGLEFYVSKRFSIYIETGYESSSVSRFKGNLTYRVVTEEDTSQGTSTFYYGKDGLKDEEPEKWYTFSYDGFRLKGGLRIWLGK